MKKKNFEKYTFVPLEKQKTKLVTYQIYLVFVLLNRKFKELSKSRKKRIKHTKLKQLLDEA